MQQKNRTQRPKIDKLRASIFSTKHIRKEAHKQTGLKSCLLFYCWAIQVMTSFKHSTLFKQNYVAASPYKTSASQLTCPSTCQPFFCLFFQTSFHSFPVFHILCLLSCSPFSPLATRLSLSERHTRDEEEGREKGGRNRWGRVKT